ncbi:hypothetical protein KM043_000334 [Ampulex compressa]|nr:hypothetical protein KM043_000334 [Ampulex compressa]
MRGKSQRRLRPEEDLDESKEFVELNANGVNASVCLASKARADQDRTRKICRAGATMMPYAMRRPWHCTKSYFTRALKRRRESGWWYWERKADQRPIAASIRLTFRLNINVKGTAAGLKAISRRTRRSPASCRVTRSSITQDPERLWSAEAVRPAEEMPFDTRSGRRARKRVREKEEKEEKEEEEDEREEGLHHVEIAGGFERDTRKAVIKVDKLEMCLHGAKCQRVKARYRKGFRCCGESLTAEPLARPPNRITG